MKNRQFILGCLLSLVVVAMAWALFRTDFARTRVINGARASYATKGISGVSEFCGSGRYAAGEPLIGGNIISRLGVPFKCYTVFGPHPMPSGENSAFYVRIFRYSDEETAEKSPASFKDDELFALAYFKGREY